MQQPDSPLSLTNGQIVFNRYRLKMLVGKGATGVVWRAHDQELEIDIALKFLAEQFLFDPGALADLKRETRRGMALSHSHIIRIYGFFQDGQQAAIAMEYVEGNTVHHLQASRAQGIFEVEEMGEWTRQLCAALHYAHTDAQLVHRDLKPGNLLIDDRGRLKIADFGIAASINDANTRVIGSTEARGTLAYMSPQQLLGQRPCIGHDIYSLGATLYDFLTSRPPFYSGDISLQVCNVVPPSLADRRQELGVSGALIPPAWEATIAACLAKDASVRPQSAAEVAERLGLGPLGMLAANTVPAFPLSASSGSNPSGLPPQPPTVQLSAPTAPNAIQSGNSSPSSPTVQPALSRSFGSPTDLAPESVPPTGHSALRTAILVGSGATVTLLLVLAFVMGRRWHSTSETPSRGASASSPSAESARPQPSPAVAAAAPSDKQPEIAPNTVRDATAEVVNAEDPAVAGRPSIQNRNHPLMQRLLTAREQQAGRPAPGPGLAEPSERLGPADRPEARRAFVIPTLGVVMAWIPPGSNAFGDPTPPEPGEPPGRPPAQIRLREGLWMGQLEISVQEYQAVMGALPAGVSATTEDLPVNYVTWQDAMQFCHKLSDTEKAAGRLPEGYVYRLPTEVEWEYAARSGVPGPFGPYRGDVDDQSWSSRARVARPQARGKFPATPWGICDLYGNVAEWCLDWYSPQHPTGIFSDYSGPRTGNQRVVKGGSYADSGDELRAAARVGMYPNRRDPHIGFRIVLAREFRVP